MLPPRQWSPYEHAHLIRRGFNPDDYLFHSEPVEYITGEVEFAGQTLIVTPDVLIPRLETEELIGHVLKDLQQIATTTEAATKAPLHVLEIGTGSGALGLCLALAARQMPWKLEMMLSEISASALAIAERNRQKLGLQPSEVLLIESDLLAAIPPASRFEVVVANLPYIPTSRIATLDPSVKDHEPYVALDGGEDGAALIRRCIHELPAFLADSAVLWLEVDYTHTLNDFGLDSHWQGEILIDHLHRARFARLVYTA